MAFLSAMPDRPLLITGATGFVGRHLANRLLATSHREADLRMLVRSRAKALALGLPAAALIEGDLRDAAAVAVAVRDAGAVIHLAGVLKALRRTEFDAGNRLATRTLLHALVAANPHARLIHISSLSAAGPSVDGRGTDAPPDRCHPCSTYGRSKLAAERELLAFPSLHWLVLRPPIVYGPGDEATQLLLRQAAFPIVAVPWRPRPLSLIHVDDLVTAIQLALTSPLQHTFLPLEGPDRTTTTALLHSLAVAQYRRPPIPIPIPLLLAHAAALCADAYNSLRRRASFFNRDKICEIAAPGWVADPLPARTLLDFQPRISLQDGLAALVAPGA